MIFLVLKIHQLNVQEAIIIFSQSVTVVELEGDIYLS